MRVYSIDVKVYATAYIKAASEEEAREIARGLANDTLEVEDAGSEIEISGKSFDDAELPDVSLSPAMTIHGPDDDAVIECVHDDESQEGA